MTPEMNAALAALRAALLHQQEMKLAASSYQQAAQIAVDGALLHTLTILGEEVYSVAQGAPLATPPPSCVPTPCSER